MKRILSIIFFLICIPIIGKSQYNIDSLIQVLESNLNDTSKLQSQMLIGEYYYQINPDTALKIWYDVDRKTASILKNNSLNNKIVKALRINLSTTYNDIGYVLNSKGDIENGWKYFELCIDEKIKLNDKKGIALIYSNCGMMAFNQGDITKAQMFDSLSYNVYNEIKDSSGLAKQLNNIGFVSQHIGNIDMALDNYYKALKISESNDKIEDALRYINNIALIYELQGDYDEALSKYEYCKEMNTKINNQYQLAISLNNIGHIYLLKGQKQLGLDYYYQCLEIQEKMNDLFGIANSYSNIGDLEDQLGNKEKGIEYLLKSESLRLKLDDKQGLTSVYNNLGNIYFDQNNLVKSKFYATKCYTIAQEIGFPEKIMFGSFLLYLINKKEKKWDKAIEFYEIHVSMKDSIKNESTQKATIRQQTKYEFEKAQLIKEQEEKEKIRNQKLETDRRNNLQYSIIFVALLAVFGLVLTLGLINVSSKFAEGLIFFAFLIFFEFLLVLTDPYIENFTKGAPVYKLLANAILAAAIFPAHAFFENLLKKKIINKQ